MSGDLCTHILDVYLGAEAHIAGKMPTDMAIRNWPKQSQPAVRAARRKAGTGWLTPPPPRESA
jgi:hypothetical protein